MAYGSSLNALSDSAYKRKERGAFFTPPELARYLSEFAVRSGTDAILEPSCGEGEFLLAAGNRLLALGMQENQIQGHLVGCELHEASAALAQRRLATEGIHPTILVGDFFSRDPVATFDAVVGNPPYIRFQQFSTHQAEIARASSQRAGVRLDAQASSWAPFVVHAAQFLRPGGRMAFVLPAELLSTNYAAPVRRYLVESFPEVNLVLFEEPVFPEVQEEVVLLLADGFGQGDTDSIRVTQVRSLEDLHSADGRDIAVSGSARWPIGVDGRDSETLLSSVSTDCFCDLGSWGRVRLGAVTGSNKYFTLTAAEVCELELDESDVAPLCPPGSAHLRRICLSKERWTNLADQDARAFLFYPRDAPSSAAAAYIAYGEQEGVSKAYKCRKRNPWWKVPGVSTCDAFLTYMNGAGPNLCANAAGVASINSVHGLFLKESCRDLGMNVLPTLFMSTVTQLSAEVRGRAYGGGLLKLEPREASQLLVVSADIACRLSSEIERMSPHVDKLLDAGKRDEATQLVDELLERGEVVSPADNQLARELLRKLRTRREQRGSARRRR